MQLANKGENFTLKSIGMLLDLLLNFLLDIFIALKQETGVSTLQINFKC